MKKQKILNLIHFRVNYYNRYKSRSRKNNIGTLNIAYSIAHPTDEEIKIAEKILEWIASGLAWDFLKIAIFKISAKLNTKKLDSKVKKIVSDKNELRRYVDSIKKGLSDFDKLDQRLKEVIKNEAETDFYVKELLKNKKNRVLHKDVTRAKKSVILNKKAIEGSYKIKFTAKEKKQMKTKFLKYIKQK